MLTTKALPKKFNIILNKTILQSGNEQSCAFFLKLELVEIETITVSETSICHSEQKIFTEHVYVLTLFIPNFSEKLFRDNASLGVSP